MSRVYYVPVLDILKKALAIRGRGNQENIQQLEAFLNTYPAESNYIYENRIGFFGFSAEFVELTAPRQSHSTLAQHIQVQKLLPQCEVGLTATHYQDYLNLPL